VTYGPLLNGAAVLVFEGAPNYPDSGRCWDIVDKYKVTIFYTAPTLVRSLMRDGPEYVTRYSRKSLRVLGSVGEPINPSAWRWFYNVVGDSQCPISDTWWQTETGGFMMTPLPGAWPQKPGSATFPFFGVQPVIVDEKGQEIEGECSGYLCIKKSWPGAFRTLYGDHDRYETTYFKPFAGYYFTGDGCSRDKDGYHWLTGRVDDVINVSGHRIGTAEVESALVSHPQCAEAAVVGVEHEVKGQGIYAFVTLVDGVPYSEELRKSLIAKVRNQIGAFAAPDKIHWAPGLPKTRSGKIMRRILRKIAAKQLDELGDISTLADPGVVDQLIALKDC
jgi:acetyl-CoA synthetase